jgi:hypothetical protein
MPDYRHLPNFQWISESFLQGGRKPIRLLWISKDVTSKLSHVPMRAKAQKAAPTRAELEPFHPLFIKLKTQPCMHQHNSMCILALEGIPLDGASTQPPPSRVSSFRKRSAERSKLA